MMHFADYRESDKHWIVDGYSDRKTMTGAIRDFGRWIRDNIDEGEGKAIIEGGKDALIPFTESMRQYWREYGPCYYFEMEEVPCASLYDEDTDTVLSEDAHWYLVASLIK